MVHDTDIVELELKSKKFSLSVKKKEALEKAEPVYQQLVIPYLFNCWQSSVHHDAIVMCIFYASIPCQINTSETHGMSKYMHLSSQLNMHSLEHQWTHLPSASLKM